MRKGKQKTFTLLCGLGLLGALLLPANPISAQPPGGQGQGQGQGQGRGNWRGGQRGDQRGGQEMDPERRARREQMMRQRQVANLTPEQRQKYLLESAGIKSTTIQNSIIAFAAELAAKRQEVTQVALSLSALLADDTASNMAIGDELKKLEEASQKYREWSEAALKEFDEKIGYSKDVRLKSLLVLIGIIGDAAGDAGGFNAIFPKGLVGEGDIADLLPAPQMGEMGGGGEGRGNWRGRGNQRGGMQREQ